MLFVVALGLCVAAHVTALLCCGSARGGFAEGLATVGVPPCPTTATDGGGVDECDDEQHRRSARASRAERAPLSPENSCKDVFGACEGAGEGSDATTAVAAATVAGGLSVTTDADDEDDEADLHMSESELECRCAAPWLVAELELVAAWLQETLPGEARPGQSPAASFVGNKAVAAKPRRYKLAEGEPFVMVSYQQAWCIGNWRAMAAALRTLHGAGWRHVWIDVAIVSVDDDHPYVQCDFEKAMRWAVEHAAAIYNPMTGFSGKLSRPPRACRLLPRCLPPRCLRKSDACEVSHLYLKRPWCLYEAGMALRRRVLWCAAPLAFTRAGAMRERRRLVGLAAAALWLWLVACLAFVGVLSWYAAARGGYTTRLTLLEGLGYDMDMEAAVAFQPYLSLALNGLFGVALGALVLAEACTQSLSRQVVHLRRHVIAGGAGLGTGLMFDLGDSAVLGRLTRRGGGSRGLRVRVADSSPDKAGGGGGGGRAAGVVPLSGAVCVLEQMITWHAQQQKLCSSAWWPQRWCVIGASVGGGGGGGSVSDHEAVPRGSGGTGQGAVMGQRADGQPCRELGASASWLDGVGDAGDVGGEAIDGGVDAPATPGWEVSLGELRAVEGMHWLLCVRGAVVAVRHVPASAEAQLGWYMLAYAFMKVVHRLDALFADGRGEAVLDEGRGGRGQGTPAWVVPTEDGLWLAVWAALTLHGVWLHGGPLLAWAAARARRGCCVRARRAAVLHATMGGRPPWAEALLTLVKGLVPWTIVLDTPPLQAAYVALALFNVALGALVLLKLLLSLEGAAPRCLSTAGYVLGRSTADGARGGRPHGARKRWPAPPPAAPPRLESKASANGSEGAFLEFFRRTRTSSDYTPNNFAVDVRRTSTAATRSPAVSTVGAPPVSLVTPRGVEMASGGLTRWQDASRRHLFQNQTSACTGFQATPTI